jgi:hypothetical protein
MVFSIWNERNVCLSWDETQEWAKLLDLDTVHVAWRGIWDEKKIREMEFETWAGDPCEGYVIRPARAFHYKEFKSVVAKYVRKNHVQTHGHWMRQAIQVNGLRAKQKV